MLHKLLSACLLLLSIASFSQDKKGHPFGELLVSEKNLTAYKKDTTANAVVLYERGDNYFKVINGYIKLVKDYHIKIKIFNKKEFDQSIISIPYYHNAKSSEEVTKIEAITHNDGYKKRLSSNQIYTKDLSERWKEKTFTFPDVKEGSILEYKYRYTSPFFFNLTGWEFQTDIPKIYSEFNAKIPGNYTYNRVLAGFLKLDVNDASIKKGCFKIDGYPNPADCEVLQYIMKDIPSFNEEEEYMLAASNYKSRIEFELSQHHGFDGVIHKYTKSWETVDREFRVDKDFGKQLTKKNFFEKNVPEDLLIIEKDTLSTAKKIYEFIRDHYTWDGKNSTYGRARVKEAFNNKKGNAWEINMSLINLLNAAGIKSNMMLMSTRKSGLPKTAHPVMSDFNYILVRTKIAGQTYLLNATDKYLPFGSLPYRTLNHYGRVMDFKNESYWEKITPKHGSRSYIMGQLNLDPKNNSSSGTLRILNTGYNAITTNREKDELGEEDYIEELEESTGEGLEIVEYNFEEEKSTPLKTQEIIHFETNINLDAKRVYLNPFLVTFFKSNPFLSEKRNFPVDFGYKRRYTFILNCPLPEGYILEEMPEKKSVKLGDNYGSLRFLVSQQNNTISISFDLTLNKSHLKTENYEGIKELFKHVTQIQNNTLLVLRKKD